MLSGDKGFSLVEIVVAMAILSIVAAIFLTLMTFSAGMIFTAGNKSEQIFETQGEVDNKIVSVDPVGSETTIKVTFPNGSDVVEVHGERLEEDYEGFSGSIIYFLPD